MLHDPEFYEGASGCEILGRILPLSESLCPALKMILVAAIVLTSSLAANAYMPPPDPCELAPLYYAPPGPPGYAGPPPPFLCGECPPVRCYPRKLVGPPPCPITVCKCPPPPTPATYRCTPPPACPPPPCGPPPCAPPACAPTAQVLAR